MSLLDFSEFPYPIKYKMESNQVDFIQIYSALKNPFMDFKDSTDSKDSVDLKIVENLVSLKYEQVYRAISRFEECRESIGISSIMTKSSYTKKQIFLELPLERQFAGEAPNYRSILTLPETAYLDDFDANVHNMTAKFVFLHNNGNLYYVYKNMTRKTMFVNILEDYEDYLKRKGIECGFKDEEEDADDDKEPVVFPPRVSIDSISISIE